MRLRSADDLQRINYFTAIVDGAARVRQEALLRALSTTRLVTVILGKFKRKTVKCRVPACAHSGSREFDAPQEKGTDVNIAIRLLDDALHDRADKFVLVSGDSDLVPAVNLARQRRPDMEIIVYVPTRNLDRGAAVELRAAANRHRTFPLALLPVCQFPKDVSDGRGGTISKPPD